MNYTHQEMLDLINKSRQRLNDNTRENSSRENDPEIANNSRELVIANDANSREVYKDKKIKRYKDVSREEREEQMSLTSSPLDSSVEEENPQEDLVSNITPANTSSRVTGISMQHVITEKGLKLNVAVQTEQDSANGEYVELTAELKRHSRLRELKLYQPDSYEFQQLYLATIEELKQLKPADGKNVAMGRLHARGARGQWFADMMAVAILDDNLIKSVNLNINGEEFEITLDGALSPQQERLYHSTGIFGQLKSQKPAPTLATAKRKTFNP